MTESETPSLFGMTLLGADSLKESAKNALSRPANAAIKQLDEAFEQYIVPEQIAQSLGVEEANRHNWALRRDVFAIVTLAITNSDYEARKEGLTPEERDAIFAAFDTDTSALVHYDELKQSFEQLLARSHISASPAQYSSASLLLDERSMRKRYTLGPAHTQRQPVTQSQVIGWHSSARQATNSDSASRPLFSKPHSDVTKGGEGVTFNFDAISRGF